MGIAASVAISFAHYTTYGWVRSLWVRCGFDGMDVGVKVDGT